MGELNRVLSGGQLAGGNSASKREENDFYATDPQTLKLFLYEFLKDNSLGGKDILEPACGEGHISETIKEILPNCEILSTDLIDRGYGQGGVDFLTHDYGRTFGTVITNPPFSLFRTRIRLSLLESSDNTLSVFSLVLPSFTIIHSQ